MFAMRALFLSVASQPGVGSTNAHFNWTAARVTHSKKRCDLDLKVWRYAGQVSLGLKANSSTRRIAPTFDKRAVL